VEIVAGLIFAVIGLAILIVPFILPLVGWANIRTLRQQLRALESKLDEQRIELEFLTTVLRRIQTAAAAGGVTIPPPAPEATTPPPISERVPEPVAPPVIEPEPEVPAVSLDVVPTPQPEPEPAPEPEPVVPVAAFSDQPTPAAPIDALEPPPLPPPPPPAPPEPPAAPIDWEALAGKLAASVAGIALVIAAVFFLRYSAQHGWLQPLVRVAIGVIVAVGLLVVCEMKAARRYPILANALDAAAIAILFATFFAAHALWALIPGLAAFALLALVTALAVMLSIRRESLFIAVLGLMGGFATPALLSTGENRPIPLFAYLLLLNVGLAWVAYRNTWPVLTWLTLIFTTIYQWGWVMRYLDASQLPIAMAVFIVFPAVSVGALMLGRGREREEGSSDSFGLTAVISAALPLLFAIYLATVPAYGANPGLLFGFLLLIDLGLLAVAVARREELLHGVGALATLTTMGVWLGVSYSSASRGLLIPLVAAFVLLYLFAPAVAARFGRPFTGVARQATMAAPLLLFVFVALAGLEPAYAAPWPLFLQLLGLVLMIAGRAIAVREGRLYFTAAFFTVAAQAVWSATHLTPNLLSTAVAIYTTFGIVALGVPIIARRLGRDLEPAWGGGAVLIISLMLLLFLSFGDIAAEALWALALLLAILNAALFIESAAGRLPVLSQFGSLLSWVLLATWWASAAAAVGVVPSLTVLTGLALITLAGHAWSVISARSHDAPADFTGGLYLAIAGHLFLALLSTNPKWTAPPWPVLGSLAVITLATTAASLIVRVPMLHAAGVVASAIVVVALSASVASPPYGMVVMLAAGAVGVYALVWPRVLAEDARPAAAAGAAGALLGAHVAGIGAMHGGGAPPFPAVAMLHTGAAAAVLWLSGRYGWKWLAPASVIPAWLVMLDWRERTLDQGAWQQLLTISSLFLAVFAAYPVLRGRAAATEREPYFGAIAASALFFIGGRTAFESGNLGWMVGVIPVVAGAVLALLLRHLLSMQTPGERDMGRLALVAGSALAFVTVAIPLQLDHQWITIGWALEGAALAWLFVRIPHRGLLYATVALLAAVFVRLALNPEIFFYEPRGPMRIFNWYLYTYLVCAAAMLFAGTRLARTEDQFLETWVPRPSQLLPAAAVVLLFLLLNIEIADYYATGPEVTFRFGVTVSQDLTYTIGWLLFGMGLLAAGIYLRQKAARIAAIGLIAVTTVKCFLYDLGSLEGLYRVASFVGLALSLALVSLVLQKFVLSKPRDAA
jgi:hypothetical protein